MNTLGNKLRATVFGQSHAPMIGVTVDGLPAGIRLDMEKIQGFLDRRAPGQSALSTARKEADIPKIISGLNDAGSTCGAPLTAVFENGDVRSRDYSRLRSCPRPGHADYTAYLQCGEEHDIRGGGQFSGRLTAPLCFAGAVCMQYLAKKGIRIGAHIARLAGIDDEKTDWAHPQVPAWAAGQFPAMDTARGEEMQAAILAAKRDGDSVGGVIECIVTGLPGGLGSPMFGGVENRMAAALFGIPAVRGVEFGAGFAAADMRGSEHNDPFRYEDGCVKTQTNRHGGVLGGITTGMPLIVRMAIKPTPSIAKAQQTVDLKTGENAELVIEGRHDPCIVPRAVPVMEAVAALVIMDILMEG